MAWILYERQKENLDQISNFNFEQMQFDEKLDFLDQFLCDNFEIEYNKDTYSIRLFDKMMEEEITENGFRETNLSIFIDNLVKNK